MSIRPVMIKTKITVVPVAINRQDNVLMIDRLFISLYINDPKREKRIQ